jgi:hypothetical protein
MPINFFLFFLLYFLSIYIYKMAKIKKKKQFPQVSSKYSKLVFAYNKYSRIIIKKTKIKEQPNICIDILRSSFIDTLSIRLKSNIIKEVMHNPKGDERQKDVFRNYEDKKNRRGNPLLLIHQTLYNKS